MDDDIFGSVDFLAQVDQVIAQHEHSKVTDHSLRFLHRCSHQLQICKSEGFREQGVRYHGTQQLAILQHKKSAPQARRGAQNNTNGSPHDAAPPPAAHGQPGAAQQAPRQPEIGAWPPPLRTAAIAAAPRAPLVAAAPRRAEAAVPAAGQRPRGPGPGLGSPPGGRPAPEAFAAPDSIVTSLPGGPGPSASGGAGMAPPAPQPAAAPSQHYFPSRATQPYGLGNGSLLEAQLAGPPPLAEGLALRAAERERDELQRRLNEASGQASLLRSRAERTEREKRDLQARSHPGPKP